MYDTLIVKKDNSFIAGFQYWTGLSNMKPFTVILKNREKTSIAYHEYNLKSIIEENNLQNRIKNIVSKDINCIEVEVEIDEKIYKKLTFNYPALEIIFV